jgi:hypothetical protein
MKKLIVSLTVLFLVALSASAGALSSQELKPAGWWGYDALVQLSAEDGKVLFFDNAPVSVAEIKSYLNQIDYDSLSDSGKKLYDRLLDEFKQPGIAFKSDAVSISGGLQLNPELYYKSNKNIDWTFNYYYKDNVLTVPISIDVFDSFFIETDLFLGKAYWAVKQPDNFTNVPLGYNDFEFLFPKNAYFSTGKKLTDSSGISFQMGRAPLSIGNAETPSIILSECYETDFFAKASFYSPKVRYELLVIQQEVNKYFYLHHLEVRPFDKFQLGAVEGMFINAPFELRFLNPLTIMHQMAPWISYDGYNESTSDGDFKYYGESRVCAYLGVTFDWSPCKYLRVYGLYAQNEIQSLSELESVRGRMFPNSLGGQLGAELNIPSRAGGYWQYAVEGLYTTPWLYIKHDPDWSLFRARLDNLYNDGPICSWVGTPLGPDSIAAEAKFGYDSGKKWNVNLVYSLIVQGENSFNLFYKDGTWKPNPDYYDEAEDEYTYYPVAGFDAGKYTEEEAIAIARNEITPTGTPQYNNSVAVNASYAVNDRITLSGKVVYTAVMNNDHVVDNFQQGVEVATSVKITLLK